MNLRIAMGQELLRTSCFLSVGTGVSVVVIPSVPPFYIGCCRKEAYSFFSSQDFRLRGTQVAVYKEFTQEAYLPLDVFRG